MEEDSEDDVVLQELLNVDYGSLQKAESDLQFAAVCTEPSVHESDSHLAKFFQGYNPSVEVEKDLDNFAILQEWMMEPTGLDPDATPDILNFELSALDPQPSTISGGDTETAPFSTELSPSPPKQDEDDSSEGCIRIPFGDSFVICRRIADNESILREKHDLSDTKETSMHMRDGDQRGFGVPSSSETKKRRRRKRSSSRRTPLKVPRREKRYKCGQCEYSTSKAGTFRKHMYAHTGEKPYKCEQCVYTTSQSRHLKVHMRIHTGAKPYKCEECGYSASHLGSLKLHTRTHTGEKPFKCDQCEYSASELSNFKKHMRTHTGEKPYKCEQCEYRATDVGTLKRHMRTHMAAKSFNCGQCGFIASRIGSLKRHMLTHRGLKPYTCGKCPYSAADQSSLKRHTLIHMADRPHKCGQCEFSTSRLDSLKRHIQIHLVPAV